MTTARTIVKRALQIAGVLTKDEDPSADESVDGLSSLNDMIGSWANDNLLVYALTWEDFSITGGTDTYTIGSSGDFNTAIPTQIIQAHTKDSNVKYQDLNIVSDAYFNRLDRPNISGYPEFINFNRAYPLGTIRLFPKPSVSLTLSLLTEKPITALALDDTISLPSGWERALKYNLAVEIASEYGQQVDPAVVKIANDALSAIRIATARNQSIDYSYFNGRQFDIYKGY